MNSGELSNKERERPIRLLMNIKRLVVTESCQIFDLATTCCEPPSARLCFSGAPELRSSGGPVSLGVRLCYGA